MHLSDYMARHGLDDDAMVEEIRKATKRKLSRPTISRIRRRIVRPTWETLDLLHKATGGAVTADDFRQVA
jgi:hypothetical protein